MITTVKVQGSRLHRKVSFQYATILWPIYLNFQASNILVLEVRIWDQDMGFRIWDSEFGIQNLGFRIWGLGSVTWNPVFGIEDLGLRIWDLDSS